VTPAYVRRPLLLLALLGAPALFACDASERAYAEVARRHIEAGGPRAACCSPHGYGNPGVAPDCERSAETQCAFARGATIAEPKVNAPPNGIPTVWLDLSGPNGNAQCTVHLSENGGRRRHLRVEDCFCAPK
jgi:hypothetical protein